MNRRRNVKHFSRTRLLALLLALILAVSAEPFWLARAAGEDTQVRTVGEDELSIQDGVLIGVKEGISLPDRIKIIIPDGVVTIKAEAFITLQSLEEVEFSKSVKTIGRHAFAECENLKKLVIPGNVTNINSYAFSGCKSLTSVVFLYGEYTIGDFAFADCPQLQEVIAAPSVIFSEDQYTVFGPFSTPPEDWVDKKLTIYAEEGSSVESYVNSLKTDPSVDIDVAFTPLPDDSEARFPYEWNADNTVTVTGYAGASTTPTIPETIGGKKVTAIGTGEAGTSFAGKTGLTGVSIPGSVTEIEDNAFNGCKGITEVKLPEQLKTIGASAFEGSGLTSVTLPESVTSVGNRAFAGCTDLTEAKVLSKAPATPNFGTGVFDNCSVDLKVWGYRGSGTDSTFSPSSGSGGPTFKDLNEQNTLTITMDAETQKWLGVKVKLPASESDSETATAVYNANVTVYVKKLEDAEKLLDSVKVDITDEKDRGAAGTQVVSLERTIYAIIADSQSWLDAGATRMELNQMQLRFMMPAANITITAKWVPKVEQVVPDAMVPPEEPNPLDHDIHADEVPAG